MSPKLHAVFSCSLVELLHYQQQENTGNYVYMITIGEFVISIQIFGLQLLCGQGSIDCFRESRGFVHNTSYFYYVLFKNVNEYFCFL